MAQTTAPVSAKNVYISVGGQDISGSSNMVELNPERMIGEGFTFDGDYNLAVPGKRRWSGSLRIFYTEVTNEAYDEIWQALIADTPIAIVIRPKGTGVPLWEFTGTVLFGAVPLSFDAGSADPAMVACTFVGSGALTKAAQT